MTMTRNLRHIVCIWLALAPIVFVAVAAVVIFFARPAYPRDNGQWAQNDPAISEWYGRQMMPDHPRQSCCGEGDAYYADRVEVDAKGNVYAIITDTRDDAPLGRPNIPVGTRIPIPDFKNKDTRADPNPTGHTVIFVKWYAEQEGGNFGVLCFLPSGGV
jgi:hypothetical protein